MTLCICICHLSDFELLVGPATSPVFSVLVTMVVFPGLVRPYSLISGAGSVVSAPFWHEVEKAAAGSSTTIDDFGDSVTAATSPVDVAVHTEGGQCVLKKLDDHGETLCVLQNC